MNLLKSIFSVVVTLFGVAMSFENNLAEEGLPDYSSTPVRKSRPAIGLGFGKLLDEGPVWFEAAGELNIQKFRLAFVEELLALDSIYRRSYSEMNLSRDFGSVALGGGYGCSMEWVPGENLWIRHRYKLGTSFSWKRVHLGGVLSGWFDDFTSIEFLVGGSVKTGDNFDFFCQWDGRVVDLGVGIFLGRVSLSSSYRFPGFGTSFLVSIYWDGGKVNGFYDFNNESFDRFGFKFSKFVEKKDYLVGQ